MVSSLTLLLVTLLLSSLSLSSPIPSPSSRLIQVADDVRIWMTREQLAAFEQAHMKSNKLSVGYFDVTDFQDAPKQAPYRSPHAFPSKPTHQDTILPLLNRVSAPNLHSYIAALSGFKSRYYTTQSSVQASAYLRDLMQSFITEAGRTDANCSLVSHSWLEPSVLCTIWGTESSEIVLTGAHLDSTSRTPETDAPGADDDATGVASFVEAFRILMTSGFRPGRTLEFVAYAAEEVGLLGSQDFARRYRAEKKSVYAVYQNEMSGYPGKDRTIKILQDYVDPSLTDFVESLVEEYCDIPFETAICGYGCSDHASWTKEGFSAVCTAEAGPFGDVNPNMHTTNDVLDKLDMSFTAEFAKLGLAFLVELSYV